MRGIMMASYTNRTVQSRCIAMIVFSYYPADPRVRREAEALAKSGCCVDILCLKGKTEKSRDSVDGVSVYRLPLQRKRGGKLRYIWEYFSFIVLAFCLITYLHIRKRYRIVHVHNMPDILVISALIPRITGARIILDLHDPMPEVYQAKYSLEKTHPVIRLLVFLEKFSIHFADVVLTPNLSFKNLFIARGCPPDKIHIIMNSPDHSIFHNGSPVKKSTKSTENNLFTVMYHGTIVERNGLDTALYAIYNIKDQIPNIIFDVYGDGDWAQDFLTLVDELKLNDVVRYHGFVPLEHIVTAIEHICVGLIPNKKTPFTEINLPTRIFEYLCMNKYVIVPKTQGILDYFNDDSMIFFEPGNWKNLSQKIYDVYSNTESFSETLEKGIDVYHHHRWDIQRQYFIQVVSSLLGFNREQQFKIIEEEKSHD